MAKDKKKSLPDIEVSDLLEHADMKIEGMDKLKASDIIQSPFKGTDKNKNRK